jgi:hypothetical protein
MTRGLIWSVRHFGALSLCGVSALVLAPLAARPAGAAQATGATPPVVTSADVSLDLTLAQPGRYATTVEMTGQIDFTRHDAALTVTVPHRGPQAHDLAKGHPHSDGAFTFKSDWVDGAAYLTLPASLANLAGGGSSVSYAVSPATSSSITTALSQTDVAVTYARILLGTLAPTKAPKREGLKTIDGVRATGTEVDLSLSQLLKVVPALSPGMDAGLAPMANTEIPVTVWVDRQGRLVEAVMTQPRSATSWIAGTVRFSDFDAPVTITAPPANTVRPASKGELSFLRADDPFMTAG